MKRARRINGVPFISTMGIAVSHLLILLIAWKDYRRYPDKRILILSLTSILLLLYLMVVLFIVSNKNPGIIPRNENNEHSLSNGSIPRVYDDNIVFVEYLFNVNAREKVIAKEIIYENKTILLKYCETCKIFRPPKVSHCSICDGCIEFFDHHCGFLGNCVGKNNISMFYSLLMIGIILSINILVLIGFLLYINTAIDNPGFGYETILYIWLAMVLISIVFVQVFLMGRMIYLLSWNMTTSESIKIKDKSYNNYLKPELRYRRNPFSFLLCSPRLY
eukprot:GHVP01021525.1.p1 GENE.GHVP01021525.1~~GHVP01021525.1.p1  ORF type:complete len:276 (-),score=10.22 GHVP01021525.1:417-1244(-)